jgi:hypothetical protein
MEKKPVRTIDCKICKKELPYTSFHKTTPKYFDRSDVCKRCEHKHWGNTNHMTFKENYSDEEYEVLYEMLDLMGYDTSKNIHIQFMMRYGLLH